MIRALSCSQDLVEARHGFISSPSNFTTPPHASKVHNYDNLEFMSFIFTF